VEILLALLGAVVASLATAGISAYRERPRLKLGIGATTTMGQKPTAWIEIRAAGGRATTVREVGFYAKRVRFETSSDLRGEGEASFPFGRGIFLERGETTRFEGLRTSTRSRSTWTSRFGLTRWTRGIGACGGVPGLLCVGS
jgi:hypothetical protein